MCTVTWTRSADGYTLFFNRDERRTRLDALSPRIHEGFNADGARVRFVMPVDGDFGGTWVAANEHGLTVGLLNGYRRRDLDPGPEPRSRGLLVRDLAPLAGVGTVARRLAETDPQRYRSFRLLAVDPVQSLIAEWDGLHFLIERGAEGRVPVISSSFDETDVGLRRRETFAAEVGELRTEERLAAYHRSHAHGPSAYSVCMHRPDARTRSLTRVRVDPGGVELWHHAGPPCEHAEELAVRLPRSVRLPREERPQP